MLHTYFSLFSIMKKNNKKSILEKRILPANCGNFYMTLNSFWSIFFIICYKRILYMNLNNENDQ